MTNVSSVNSQPNRYKEPIIPNAVAYGVMGASVGATTTALKNRSTLRSFKDIVKGDEFKALELAQKKEVVAGFKNLRDNFRKIVGKSAAKYAAIGAAIGVVSTILCNNIRKNAAEKQANQPKNVVA